MRLIDGNIMAEDESEAYLKAQTSDKISPITQGINSVVHRKIQQIIADTPTIDPETLPIVQKLRAELEQYRDLGVKPKQVALLMKFFKERTSAEYIAGDMKLVADSVRVSSLEQELSKVTAERDAAIEWLADLEVCGCCKNTQCRSRDGEQDCKFEWIGVQKEHED